MKLKQIKDQSITLLSDIDEISSRHNDDIYQAEINKRRQG